MRRIFLITALAAIILLSVGTQFVNAKPTIGPNKPGDLDSNFGAKGLSYADFDTASGDKAYAVVEQSDGKIVVVGSSNSGSGDDYAVIRLKGNGQLDGSFDDDGKVTTSITTTHDVAYGVALQMDNKIVVVGTTFDGVDKNFAVVRYTTGGALDITFGGDGIVETDITAGDDIARAIAIQGDGKIVVAGTADNDFVVVRYNDDGILDNTFSGDGIVVTDFFASNDEGHAIAIDPADGDIVVAGFADTGSSEEFAAARYDSSGSLDLTFGGDGKVTTDFQSNSVDQAFGVALQEDGKVVLAGFVNSDVGGTDDFALARYNSNGSLDLTFDGDGMVVTPVGSADDQAYSVEIQPSGKIVVAGFVNMGKPRNQDFAIARYSSSGALDTTFGNSGIVLTDLGTINSENESADEAYAMTIQTDNKILVAGFSDYPAGDDNFAVARYLSPNRQPTVSNVNKNGLEEIDTFFSEADFSTSYTDPDFDNLAKIKIDSLPVTGTLSLAGIPVSITQEIFAFELSNLSIAVPSNWNGSTGFDWNGSDGLDYASAGASVIINFLPVNDAPSFTAGANQVLDEDAAPQSILAWATDISPGPVDEAGQILSFTVKTDNVTLFTTLPAVDAGTGDLSFTTAEDQNGIADVTVTLIDDGGTQNSGVDTSPSQSFTIRINAVNDAPFFTSGPDQEVDEDAGLQLISGWAPAISSGPANEAGQTLKFIVKTDNDPLFAIRPEIDAATGDLTFTPAEDQNGAATVTVILIDDGGTQNGGVDTSSPQSFTININPVNDPPIISNFEKAGLIESDIIFEAADFENQFSDIDGDTLAFVKLPSLPTHGVLSVEGVLVTVGQKIPAKDLDALVFTPEADWIGISEFTWNGSDGSSYAAADATLSISLSERIHFMLFLPMIINGS